MSETTLDSPPEQVVRIKTLRENLGFTYQHVAESQEAIIIQPAGKTAEGKKRETPREIRGLSRCAASICSE